MLAMLCFLFVYFCIQVAQMPNATPQSVAYTFKWEGAVNILKINMRKGQSSKFEMSTQKAAKSRGESRSSFAAGSRIKKT